MPRTKAAKPRKPRPPAAGGRKSTGLAEFHIYRATRTGLWGWRLYNRSRDLVATGPATHWTQAAAIGAVTGIKRTLRAKVPPSISTPKSRGEL